VDILKSIEIGENTLKEKHNSLDPDFQEFIKLGIEAQKRVLAWRNAFDTFFTQLLPGETERTDNER